MTLRDMRRRLAMTATLLLVTVAGAARADAPPAPPPSASNTPPAPTTSAPPAPTTTAPSTSAPPGTPPSGTADPNAPPAPSQTPDGVQQPPGAAAPADVEDGPRLAARKLAEEGLALYDGGRYAEALDRFERAGAVVRAPTMSLMAGRSLEKLGRLVEASERYLEATRMQLDADASEAFRTAQQDAARERAALLPRIPSLTIKLTAKVPGVTVTLDGKPVVPALIGPTIPVDPGQHTVVVTQGQKSSTQRAIFASGEARQLTFAIDLPPPPPVTGSGGGGALRAVGWTGVALGAAGVIAGVVTGGLAVSAKSNLDTAGCVDMKCPPDARGDVDRYNMLRTVSGATLVAGAVAGAAGALVVGFSGPSSQPSKQATWQTWISPGMGGARVTF